MIFRFRKTPWLFSRQVGRFGRVLSRRQERFDGPARFADFQQEPEFSSPKPECNEGKIDGREVENEN